MAVRLRRAEPAFADRSPSGPAKPGLGPAVPVPAVRVPVGEPASPLDALRTLAPPGNASDTGAGAPIPFPLARDADRRAGLPGPVVLPVPVVAAPASTDAAVRSAHRPGSAGLRWSGFASVLLHLGVALPFLFVLPSRDLPSSGGALETFEVEIVPAGDAENDRLAQAGAAPSPDVAAAVPEAATALAAAPPDLSRPPDPVAGPAQAFDDVAALPPPPDDTVVPADPTEADPIVAAEPITSPSPAADDPISTEANRSAEPAMSEPVESNVAETSPPPPAAVAPPPPSALPTVDRVASEGERSAEAGAEPTIEPEPAGQPKPKPEPRPEPVPSVPEVRAEDPTLAAPASLPEPPRAAPTRPVETAAPRDPPRVTARSERPVERPKPPATTRPRHAAMRPAAAPPSRAGAERSDGGSSAATSRAGAAAARGEGQAGAEVLASYRNRVLAHLARHKQYPDSARDRGIEGRVAVTFTLSASGQVVTAALAGSSGRPELDRITLATVQRASPFPPIPPGGPATMTFRTALRYDLR